MAATLANGRTGNLPAEVTSFVGRRREIGEIRDLFQRARLITLTGVGGVGKTRLALQAAAEQRRAFPDGAWLVELAGLDEPGLVGQSVAAALGVQEDHASAWSLSALTNLLAERQLLLVLDNCEHLLDACAVLADALLKACPALRILATSRQPLRIAGEFCVEVAPFATPGADTSDSFDTLARTDALHLFVERAAAVHPGFHLDRVNAPIVANVCRRLDGIPLALELAAGRLRTLSVQQLLDRLDSRYDVLIGGSRAALPRQQTMRALIDWSFALCTQIEQLLWARLSVFADGFGLDAAEQVCCDAQLPVTMVLEGIEGLVDKSILSAERNQGEVRYRLTETLREYGAHRLDELGERVTTQRRARDWCARVVERVTADWFSAQQGDLLRVLRREHRNIRAALTFCLTQPGESRPGLAIASGMRNYWTASGRLSEGRHWLEKLLAKSDDPSPARLRALCVYAYVSTGPAKAEAAVDRVLDEAERLALELGDVWGSAFVAQQRSLAMLFRAQPEQAVTMLEWAAEEHRRLGDRGSVAYDLALLASAKNIAGHTDISGVLEECVALCSEAGESWIRAVAQWTIGVERCRSGDISGALRALRESLELRIPLDIRYPSAHNLDALAWVAVEQADHDRAARLFGAAEAITRDVVGVDLAHGPTSMIHTQYERLARRALGTKAFDAAFAAGARMGFDDAVALALGRQALGAHAAATEAASAPTIGSGALGLTARELEVARLVASGLTNRQIAAALVISQRTAEGHVEHILTKLGFGSRAQIATWVTAGDTRAEQST